MVEQSKLSGVRRERVSVPCDRSEPELRLDRHFIINKESNAKGLHWNADDGHGIVAESD
jgi:hypothetical protein